MQAKILEIIGTTPHFMKLSPVYSKIASNGNIDQVIATVSLNDSVIYDLHVKDNKQLTIKYNLDCPQGFGSQSIAHLVPEVRKIIQKERPSIMLVIGDVDATIISAIAAIREGVMVAHIESGLRSNDFEDEQELNRIIIDRCSTILFTTDKFASRNLLKEGMVKDSIHLVGNTNIDSLVLTLNRVDRPEIAQEWQGEYGIVKIYRSRNLIPMKLGGFVNALLELSKQVKLHFFVNEQVLRALRESNLLSLIQSATNIKIVNEESYLFFIGCLSKAKFVITDSAGIQDETTYLGIPCITILEKSCREASVKIGTNTLVGNNWSKMKEEVTKSLSNRTQKRRVPELWDGKASQRLSEILIKELL
jgi:UDP-N-acetylglucosamine 2-epimerase (non-hydrolysing)